MARALVPLMFALAAAAACSAPPPPPAAAPPVQTDPPPAIDTSGAREALDVALAALSKRRYDVSLCSPAEFKVVDEAAARAGEPVGERCTMLVTRLPDRTWLVVVRAATTLAPTRGGGVQAIVSVTPAMEGVRRIEYAK